jgi:hypothetical protein
MHVSFEIPDELASALISAGQDPARVALEAWGLEAYRQRRLSAYQLRTLLGIESRYELDGVLKEHKISLYTLEDVEQDLATNEELRKKRQAEIPA